MFAGLLVNVDSLGDWISWIKYLSCVRYSLNVSRSFASHPCCQTPQPNFLPRELIAANRKLIVVKSYG